MGLKSLIIVLLLTRVLRTSSTDTGENDRIFSVAFLVLVPYGGDGDQPGWKAGPAVIPAVRLAVDRINNGTDILPGYEIQLVEGNSGCQNLPKSAYSFVPRVFNDANDRMSPRVVGVIGPACSESALLLGTLGARDGISLIQVSPSATSPLLTFTDKYPNTYRTLSTTFEHMKAVTELIRFNSWENVALLHDSTRVYFRTTTEAFLNKYSSMIGFDSEIYENYFPLGSLEAKYKVIIILAGNKLIAEALCLAYHHKPQLLFPIYQWIIVDKKRDQFVANIHFVYDGLFYNCSHEMMEQAVKGSIFTRYQIVKDSVENKQTPTDVGLTFEEYVDHYKEYFHNHSEELKQAQRDTSYHVDAEEYAISYYDATWALALALNASLGQISLSNYRHGQPENTKIIRQQMNQMKFDGLMGTVAFRASTQDSSTPLTIVQFVNGRDTIIGNYNGSVVNLFSNDAEFVADGFYRKVIGVHLAATTVSLALVTVFTIYTLLLHISFIACQNRRSIKAASFTLSHFMFSGCYLILLQTFLISVMYSEGWQTRSPEEALTRDIILSVGCNVSEWLNKISGSLVMGTLCGKLWQVYRIFNYFNTKRYLISDETLTFFIMALVSIDIVLLTVWNMLDPLVVEFEQQGIAYDRDREPVILERGFCRCTYFTFWLFASFSLAVLLGAIAVILSLLNRRITRTHFKTAKSVNVMIYMVAFSSFMAIGLGYVLESLNIHYSYVSLQLSLLSIVCLVCVFVLSPPVLSVIKVHFRR